MENRSIGFGITGISVLVAVVALAFRTGQAPPPGAPTIAAVTVPKDGDRLYPSPESAVAGYDRGRRLLAEYFGSSWATLVKRADSASAANSERGTAATDSRRAPATIPLRVTIAAIPDPFDSYLDWGYDANLEAMRRAFGTAGLVPYAFWLPERTDSLQVISDGVAVRHPAHDFEPGVMLFRSTSTDEPQLHLLYLVPEVPTAGVHALALKAAIAERASIMQQGKRLFDVDARERAELSILGPTFSGSALSLRTIIDANLADTSKQASTARLVSGSATSYKNLRVLTDSSCVAVVKRGTSTAKPESVWVSRIRFSATVNPDEAMDEMVRALVDSIGLKPYQVALLTESGTGYGAGRPTRASSDDASDPARRSTTSCLAGESALPTTGGAQRAVVANDSVGTPVVEAPVAARTDTAPADTLGRYLTVPFPLNIGSLRRAFEQSGSLASQAPSLPGLGDAPRTRLSLDERARSRESPALISDLSVPALDVVLASIVRTLSEHDVRLVIIRATDVRDKLMLARELRRGLPDVLLVLYEGHVLLRRAEYADALRGALVVSSYPLALENQFWSTSHRREQGDSSFTRLTDLLAFPTDASFGVYNATLSLLGLPQHRVEFSLHSGFARDSTFYLPPVWLSVIGRDGFYPLRAQVPSAKWWPYLGLRDADRAQTDLSVERPHEHTYTHDDFSLSILIIIPMLMILALLTMFLLGTDVLLAVGLDVPRSLARPDSAKESMFLSIFLLSLVAAYLPFSVAVDARRIIASLDPNPGGASLALWVVVILSALVFVVGLVMLGNGLLGIFRSHRTRGPGPGGGGSVPTMASKDTPAPPEARKGVAHASLGARLSSFLASMRQPSHVTRNEERVVAPETLYQYERLTTRQENPVVATGALLFIAVVSLVFLGCSVIFTGHLILISHRGGPEATLSMYRAMHLGSGVSPLLPLVILGLGFGIWAWWQLQQARTFDHHDPFESGVRLLAHDEEAETVWRRLYRSIVDARRGLSWMAPGLGVVGIVLAVCITAWFVHRRRLASLEVMADMSGPDYWFDGALWVGILSLLLASLLAIYRLVHTWHGLERFLDIIAGTPLVNAFARLALDVSHMTDVGFFGFRRDGRGDEAYAEELWTIAQRQAEHHEPQGDNLPTSIDVALEAVTVCEDHRWKRVEVGFKALRDAWEITRARPNANKDVPLEGETVSAAHSRALRALEEYIAYEVVLFVERYLRNLRRICLFLFTSLLILVSVNAQYPYQPRSVVSLAAVALLGATVISVFWVMVSLSRNETISRISRTEPGKITWDTTFILNALTFGVIPLLALASSEFPAVRSFLFSWAEPMVRAVART